jgi:hypothetical protein
VVQFDVAQIIKQVICALEWIITEGHCLMIPLRDINCNVHSMPSFFGYVSNEVEDKNVSNPYCQNPTNHLHNYTELRLHTSTQSAKSCW